MKYNFDASGSSKMNNRYVVEFLNSDTGEIVESFQLSSPLTFDETEEFIDARRFGIAKLNLTLCLRKMREDEEYKSGLGLASLAWFLEGNGITKKTVRVYFGSKYYDADPDKVEAFIKSLA